MFRRSSRTQGVASSNFIQRSGNLVKVGPLFVPKIDDPNFQKKI